MVKSKDKKCNMEVVAMASGLVKAINEEEKET